MYFQFEIIIIASCFRFIRIPMYGSTAIINILFFQCGGRLYTSESEKYLTNSVNVTNLRDIIL